MEQYSKNLINSSQANIKESNSQEPKLRAPQQLDPHRPFFTNSVRGFPSPPRFDKRYVAVPSNFVPLIPRVRNFNQARQNNGNTLQALFSRCLNLGPRLPTEKKPCYNAQPNQLFRNKTTDPFAKGKDREASNQ
ncbi:hypothetical protein ACOME3_008470 [Neoechinorhynchus agilis]